MPSKRCNVSQCASRLWFIVLTLGCTGCNRSAAFTAPGDDAENAPHRGLSDLENDADAATTAASSNAEAGTNSVTPDDRIPAAEPRSPGSDDRPDASPMRAGMPGLGSDAGSDAQAPARDGPARGICPTVFDAPTETLSLIATDGQAARFVLSSGRELELPFQAVTSNEVWSDGHFALFSPATSWALAVVSRDGQGSHHAAGAFSMFHDNFRTRAIWLHDDGTLTADYAFEGHDWTTGGPVADLVVGPDGSARELLLADVDLDGYTPYAYGLAHVETGELRELDRGGEVVHLEREGRWIGAQLLNGDSGLELTLIDANETRTWSLSPEAPPPTRLVPIGSRALVVLQQLGDGVPVLHFDVETERVTPLVDLAASDGLTGDGDGASYVLRDASDLSLRWLVDVENATVVDVTTISEGRSTAVVTGARSWFLLDAGAPFATVDRGTGAVTNAGAERAFVLGDRMFLIVDGTLARSVDLTTEESTELVADDWQVDDLTGIGDWLVGTREGLPVLLLPPDSTVGEGIDAPAGGASVSGAVIGDWLVFSEGGTPLWALSSDGTRSGFASADRSTVSSADVIDVVGDWAFGFAEDDDDSPGVHTVVWRANLGVGFIEPVSAPPGDQLFDPRYRIDATDGSTVGASIALQATDLGHATGTVTAVRRDESSSFVLTFGMDASWRPLGDPMPGEFNVVVTEGNGFFLIDRGDWNCFCSPPELSWEPTDTVAPLRQLVLTTSEPFEVLRQERDLGGSVSLDPTRSCAAWNEPSASLGIDGPSGDRFQLLTPGSFRWLAPP